MSNLLKNLKYLALDLETTGLNIHHDEPIQIGIIIFNNKFEILKTYSQYFYPEKNISELKNIVRYLTGLQYQELTKYPRFTDKIPEILNLLTPDTIIIGHNIGFDLDILQKYFVLPNQIIIDTLSLAKNFFHFLPSYALDALAEILQDKISYTQQFEKIIHHDALSDCFVSMQIFQLTIKKISELLNKYPEINKYISVSHGIYQQILNIPASQDPRDYNLPPLLKNIKNNKKIIPIHNIDWNKINNFAKIYIGNTNLSHILIQIVNRNTPTILAVSNKAKFDMMKKLLNNVGIYQFGLLSDNYIFVPDKITQFLSQPILQEFEINFILKYYSHLDQNIGYLDLNDITEYQIFHYLTTTKKQQNMPLVLTTHNKLFEDIDNNIIGDQYQIVFGDWDFWYLSLSKYLNKAYDLYEFIILLEQIVYKYKFEEQNHNLRENLQKFYQTVVIWVGIFFIEINKIFTNRTSNKLELNPIKGDNDFYKTNQLFLRILFYYEEIKNNLDLLDIQKISYHLTNIHQLFHNIIIIERKIINNAYLNFHFTIPNKLINYQEFLRYFAKHKTVFLTDYDITNSLKIIKENQNQNIILPKIEKITSIPSIISQLLFYQNICILSNIKDKSQELFEKLFNHPNCTGYKILVENITGGHGKNLVLAKKHTPKIIIGGYDFILNLIINNIKFDKFINYSIIGALEKQILTDLAYVYQQTQNIN